jgi:large subunit ribosomal protein L21
MFAVVSIAGFQEKVQVGDTLTVPTLDVEEDKKMSFSDVFMLVGDDGAVQIGAPFVAGASVEVKVLSHGRDKKIRVFKMRRRKRYMRTQGHKQGHTRIEITKINAK